MLLDGYSLNPRLHRDSLPALAFSAIPEGGRDMTTPRNESAVLSERGLLGALVQDFDRVVPVVDAVGLSAEDFTDATVRRAWSAISKLRKAGGIVDLVSVPEAMAGDAGENLLALSEMVEGCPTTEHAAFYAKQIRDARNRRKALAALKDGTTALEGGFKDPRDILLQIYETMPPGEAEAFTPSGIVSLAHFLSEPVEEPPQVIRDVLRAGQIAVGASSSKGGKTWLMQSLGLAVATGKMWLKWKTTPGRVLFIDPELCHYDGQRRMMKLIEAMGLKGPPEGFDFWRVKGKNLTIADVERHVLNRMKETGQTYTLIIVDSVYCFGGGRDENSNSEQALTMQELYTLSEASGAAVFITHHFSKGNKSMTDHLDRASGAGVFARAPDVFMTLTPHQEEGCFTVETTCRSFARPDPFVARWEYPLWRIDEELDPDSLKRPGSGRGAQFAPEQILDLLPEEGLTHGEWREKAKAELGCGKSTFNKLLGKLKTKGLAVAGFGRYVAGSGAEI